MLRTGLNVVSDFGFSNLESSLGLFFVLLLFVAVPLSLSATMRGRADEGVK